MGGFSARKALNVVKNVEKGVNVVDASHNAFREKGNR